MRLNPNPENHPRDAFREMLDSVVANGHTFDECKELVKNCTFTGVLPRARGLIGYDQLLHWTRVSGSSTTGAKPTTCQSSSCRGMSSFFQVLDRIAELVCSGMAPIIRATLSKYIGDEEAKEIEIISNDVDVLPDGKWRIKYRHPSR